MEDALLKNRQCFCSMNKTVKIRLQRSTDRTVIHNRVKMFYRNSHVTDDVEVYILLLLLSEHCAWAGVARARVSGRVGKK